MDGFGRGRLRQQVRLLQRQFLQDGGLPFTDVLSEHAVASALETIESSWNDRIYTPLVTLWVFLGQVLCADHSCRAAVARLLVHRLAHDQPACSSRTGAYCQARQRLPESFVSTTARHVGRTLESQVDPNWQWKGRRVLMFDGSTITMPDTPENQDAYPQVYNQRPGLGFPIARIGAIVSLSCGAILEFGTSRYAGKGQGEVSLLRRMSDAFQDGDILLTDRMLVNWSDFALLKERGVEMVSRFNHARRSVDFRRGHRLGKDDHIVRWRKPVFSRSIPWEDYSAMTEWLTVRETRFHVEQAGFRSRQVVVVTTLLDPEQVSKEDLAELYRARWNNELDLRSIKCTLQMDQLRCKTPELVHREQWTHVLAYNLIRTVMAQAADRYNIPSRTISFAGTVQLLKAFQRLLDFQAIRSGSRRRELYGQLLDSIVEHRVADRPDRFEPRRCKRKRSSFRDLEVPRQVAKLQMAKGHTKI